MTDLIFYWDVETVHNFDSDDRWSERHITPVTREMPDEIETVREIIESEFEREDGDCDFTAYIAMVTTKNGRLVYDGNNKASWMTQEWITQKCLNGAFLEEGDAK